MTPSPAGITPHPGSVSFGFRMSTNSSQGWLMSQGLHKPWERSSAGRGNSKGSCSGLPGVSEGIQPRVTDCAWVLEGIP